MRNKARIEELERKLRKRMGPDGPLPGFEENVEKIKAKIERLKHG